ncbi:MAG TPA: response regulator [Thermoanaerobaculia bacterium]|nr:response regulator [Thermoanaerobaculia bacterium]
MTIEQQRVLVVDDDPEVRRILVRALRQMALTIDEAADGREAIALLREHSYCVVLLDILMPDVNGFDVLNAIDAEALNAPVVLVISGADYNVLDRLDSKRIHGIVKKPFDPIEVAAVVAACAEIRGNRGFETMALATMMTGAQLIALLKL